MSKQQIINRKGHEFIITITGLYEYGGVDVSAECMTEGVSWYREFDDVNDPREVGWDADFEPWTDAIDEEFGE